MSPLLSAITAAIAFISTDMIVIVILVIFTLFMIKSIKGQLKLKAILKSLANIAKNEQAGQLPLNKLSDNQSDWVMAHLMVNEKSSDAIFIEKKGDLLVTRSPHGNMLPSSDQNKYKLIPAILTSFGITGTFIGITLGLSGFSMDGDSTELLATAMKLLEGMNTAFYTSLVGLLCSALFMIWMKISAHLIEIEQNKFFNHLSHHYVEVSAIDYLKSFSSERQDEVINAQLRSAKSMEELGQNFNILLAQFKTITNSFNSQEIANSVSEAVSGSIENQLAPAVDQIRQELAGIKEIKEQNQKELLQIIIAEMKQELITPVVEELEKTSAAVTASNQVSEQLNTNVELVITRTAETVETIDEFQKETMIKLQSFAESLKGILSSFKDDTQGAMSTIAKEVKSLLDGASTGLAEQRDAFESSATKAAGAFEGIKSSMDQALEQRQRKEQELFDGVESRINSLISGSSDAFKEQTNLLEKVGAEATGLMTSAREELESGLGDIDNKVKSMSTTVQTELEAFREQYQNNLSSYFEQQNNLLETSLGKQRDGLNGVVENFRKVFEQEYQTRQNLLADLTAQHEHLQKSAETVERVVKAIGLNEASKMAELQDAALTMSQEIAKLKREYVSASKSFADVADGLPKAMDEYFTRANESFEAFFKDFDESSSKIHNKLSQAAGYLINAQMQRREFEADEVDA